MKLDLTTTFTSSLDLPTSRTKGITRKGSEMSLVVRYLNTVRIRSAQHRKQEISLGSSVSSPHEFMLAVWWDEADSVLGLELAQLDAPER